MESSNMQQWRLRAANRIGIPRRMEGSEHGDGQAEKEPAEYGAPPTEDEPEPTHVHTEEEMSEPEREDPLAGVTESGRIDEMDLEDRAIRNADCRELS